LAGQVEDRVGRAALDRPGDGALVGDVRLDELRAGLERSAEVLASSRRQVVEDLDLVAPLQEGVDQVLADEARPTGDQRPHGHAIYPPLLPEVAPSCSRDGRWHLSRLA